MLPKTRAEQEVNPLLYPLCDSSAVGIKTMLINYNCLNLDSDSLKPIISRIMMIYENDISTMNLTFRK